MYRRLSFSPKSSGLSMLFDNSLNAPCSSGSLAASGAIKTHGISSGRTNSGPLTLETIHHGRTAALHRNIHPATRLLFTHFEHTQKILSSRLRELHRSPGWISACIIRNTYACSLLIWRAQLNVSREPKICTYLGLFGLPGVCVEHVSVHPKDMEISSNCKSMKS